MRGPIEEEDTCRAGTQLRSDFIKQNVQARFHIKCAADGDIDSTQCIQLLKLTLDFFLCLLAVRDIRHGANQACCPAIKVSFDISVVTYSGIRAVLQQKTIFILPDQFAAMYERIQP